MKKDQIIKELEQRKEAKKRLIKKLKGEVKLIDQQIKAHSPKKAKPTL